MTQQHWREVEREAGEVRAALARQRLTLAAAPRWAQPALRRWNALWLGIMCRVERIAKREARHGR